MTQLACFVTNWQFWAAELKDEGKRKEVLASIERMWSVCFAMAVRSHVEHWLPLGLVPEGQLVGGKGKEESTGSEGKETVEVVGKAKRKAVDDDDDDDTDDDEKREVKRVKLNLQVSQLVF